MTRAQPRAHALPSRATLLMFLLLATLLLPILGACGQKVATVSTRDPVLSEDSRRLLADTEDAVTIRRAARDDAQRALLATRERSRELLARPWPANAASAVTPLRTLEAGRVELATLRLAFAQAELELAKAKYTYTTAQTAMRHDLAVYELDPLREQVEARRAESDAINTRIEAQLQAVDKLETTWWAAYSAYVKGGGDSNIYFLSSGNAAQK